MASNEDNNSIVEYVDGLRNSVYALFNEQLCMHLPVIDYIPEWLVVMNDEEEEVLNKGMGNLSLELIEQDINNVERERQRQEYELNEPIRSEQELTS
jgi:hypothetical protein